MGKFVVAAILGLMLVVSQSSGKSVSSVPGCEPDVLLDCTKQLEYLNSDTALDLGASQQDLEKVCPTLQKGMQCINDYSNKCLPENIQVYFQSMYNGTISVISELCRPGDFQSEYLKHAPCMDKAKTEYKQCVDEYNGVMGRINPLEKEQRTTNIKIMCCSFSEYIECSNMLVLKRCGSDTAKFTQSLLDRLASPIIQEHCYRHFDGEKECEGIMTGLKSSSSSGKHPKHDHNQELNDRDHPHHHHQGEDEGASAEAGPSGSEGSKHKPNSPWDGAVGISEPTSNEIDNRAESHHQHNAEAAPSTNAAPSSYSSVSTFLVTLLSPLALLFCIL